MERIALDRLGAGTGAGPRRGPRRRAACGVTRTIENAIRGGLADDPDLTPRIPGHEFAGVVDAVGDGVDGVSPGDRVLAYFYLTCGNCDACRRGDTNQCTNFGGWYGVNCDGAYADQAVIPASNALPLPDGASFREGAIATDGLATPLHVCRRTDVSDADTVLVIGAAGRIGIHLSQLAALRVPACWPPKSTTTASSTSMR